MISHETTLSSCVLSQTAPETYSLAVANREALLRIEDLYTIRDYAQTMSFLVRRPHLVNLLEAAYWEVQEHFASGTTVALVLFRDREFPNVTQLFALIQTSMKVREAMEGLDRFEAAWWLDNAPSCAGELSFDLEFVS